MSCKGCEVTENWFRYGHCVLDDPRILNSFEGKPFYRPFNAYEDALPSYGDILLRNDSTPVRRLPTELLREIFMFLPDFLQTSEWLHNNPYSHWISIVAVCKLWRDVAIACPALWTCISTDFAGASFKPDLQVVGLLLKRSTPLSLTVTIMSETPFDILRRIYGQLHRIKRLKVQTNREIQALKLLQNTFVNMKALRLEVLELCSSDNRLTTVDLPMILCPGARPLRCLTLRQCHIQWDNNAYDKLQILILDRIDLHGRAAPDTAAMLTLLRNCPNLDMLCIDLVPFNASRRPVVEPDATYPPVKLPYLQRLVLKHISAGVCNAFMQHVQFPERTRWTVHSHDFPWHVPVGVMPKFLQNSESVTELRAYIADKEGYFLAPSRFGRLAVSTYKSNNEKVSVAHIVKLTSPMHWTSITSLVLVVQWPREKQTYEDLLCKLTFTPSTTEVPQRPEQYEGAWRILFKALPSLTSFTFSCGRVSADPVEWNTRIATAQTARTEAEIFLALGPPHCISGAPTFGKDAYLCHDLKTLHLSAVNFLDWNPKSADEAWRKMVYVLKQRKKHGIALQKLVLKDVVGVPADADSILRNCADDVELSLLQTQEPSRRRDVTRVPPSLPAKRWYL